MWKGARPESIMPYAEEENLQEGGNGGYLRMPTLVDFSRCWRSLRLVRLGLVMMNVPLPR